MADATLVCVVPPVFDEAKLRGGPGFLARDSGPTIVSDSYDLRQ